MNQKIKCTKCGNQIDIESTIKDQFLDKEKAEINTLRSDLLKRERDLEINEKIKKDEYQSAVADGVKEGLKKLEKDVNDKVRKEHSDGIYLLNEELEDKNEQLKEMNSLKAILQKLTREKDAWQSRMDEAIESNKSAALLEQKAEYDLKLQDMEKRHIQSLEKVRESERALTQGSVKNQGTVQEESIKNCLERLYPHDTIEEIKPGSRGADVLQMVRTGQAEYCGSIYYESKRTKNFDEKWVPKLKRDMQEKNANFGVIITQSMPTGMDRAGIYKGIWVCRLHEYIILSEALRVGLVELKRMAVTNVNKDQKMESMYDFMVSTEFSRLLQSIVEKMDEFRIESDRLNRYVQKTTSSQKKINEDMISDVIAMYAKIKGIGGNAVPSVPLLELPDSEPTLARDTLSLD